MPSEHSPPQDVALGLAQQALGLDIHGPIGGEETLIRTTWPKASMALQNAWAAGHAAARPMTPAERALVEWMVTPVKQIHEGSLRICRGCESRWLDGDQEHGERHAPDCLVAPVLRERGGA